MNACVVVIIGAVVDMACNTPKASPADAIAILARLPAPVLPVERSTVFLGLGFGSYSPPASGSADWTSREIAAAAARDAASRGWSVSTYTGPVIGVIPLGPNGQPVPVR